MDYKRPADSQALLAASMLFDPSQWVHQAQQKFLAPGTCSTRGLAGMIDTDTYAAATSTMHIGHGQH